MATSLLSRVRTAPAVPWASLLTFALACLALVAVAETVRRDVPLTGDEPHYLVIAHSLLVDHDLDVKNEYQQRVYAPYYPGDLAPQVWSAPSDETWKPWHLPGLALVVLPGYAVAPVAGPIAIAIVCLAWLAVEIRLLLRQLGANGVAAALATAAVLLSPPVALYAGRVMPEAPAAALVAAAFRRTWVGTGLPVAAVALIVLPLLGPKFLAISVALLVVGVIRRRTWLVPLGLATISGVALLGGFLWVVYGSPNPNVLYRGEGVLLSMLPVGALGQLADAEHGLILRGPLFVAALILLVPLGLRRERRTLAIAVAIVVAAAWGVASLHGAYWGGFFFAPRYLVPVLPLLAVPLGLLGELPRFWWVAVVPAAVASLALLIVSLVQPQLALSYGSGDSFLLAAIGRATGLTLAQNWPSAPRPAVQWIDFDLRSATVRQETGSLADGVRLAGANDPPGVLLRLAPKLLAGGHWVVSATWRASAGEEAGALVVDALTPTGWQRLVSAPLVGVGDAWVFNEVNLPLGAPTFVSIAVEHADAPLAVRTVSWRAIE
ncbi:MAG: hypothetical protein U0556_19640 [Dehalococcoidia bacterium]